MSTSIAQNIEALCQEQGIERDLVIEAMKEAVRAAAKKQFKSGEDIQVDWNPETGIELSSSKVVVDEVTNDATELSIEQARELAGDEVEIGDALLLPLPMEELGRIAAQTAKQILFQKVRDAVRSNVYVAINQIAYLVDVLLVNVAANRVSDLLKQDLLSRLSGNAAKFFHRQGQEESIAQFDFLTGELPSLVYRKFGCLIGHFTNHHFCCRKLNARVWIPIDLNILAGTKLLFGSRSHSFLHCVDYEIP